MYYIGVKQSFLFLYYMYYVTAEIITPQIINAYDSGENSKSAVRYLASAGHNVPVTLDAHTHVRNYLIVRNGREQRHTHRCFDEHDGGKCVQRGASRSHLRDPGDSKITIIVCGLQKNDLTLALLHSYYI